MATSERSDRGDADTVQRTLFSGPAGWVSDDLYSRILTGVALRRRHEAELHPGAVVHTNAYFGRFEASYWQRWTEVRAVRVSVVVSGSAQGVMRLRATDIAGHERTVETTEVTADDAAGGTVVEMDAPLSNFIDGGALWLELQAMEGVLTFSDVRWSVAEEDVSARASPTTAGLAIAICTFNRADECANTVAALASDTEILGLIDRVYVTDQGTDPVDSRRVFQDAAHVLGDRLRYIRQPNLGGAGGFTRGMYEATPPGGEHMDVLLMDDDVRIEPETITRIAGLNRHTHTAALIGAQMLYLYNPDYLLASAERADLAALAIGLPADECCLMNESVVDYVQERRIDAAYNGWWTCLIPARVIEAIGLPLPLFFQRDDIEYAYRAASAGNPTVTLPGAAVWHADFYWKDHDDFSLFYGERNGLIAAAMQDGFDTDRMTGALSRRIACSIVGMRYGKAKTYVMAIEAFLDGPGELDDGGPAALSRVRSERASYRETATIPIDGVPARVPTRRAVGSINDAMSDLVLAKRLAKQFSGKVEPGPVAIPYEDAFWWHVSLFDEAYVTDGSQTGVRHLRRDAALARRLAKESAAVLRRFRAEASGVAARFRAAQPDLVSRENWERLFSE